MVNNMKGFKETEIGLIPDAWDIRKLEKTGEVIYGIQAAVANNLKPIAIEESGFLVNAFAG